MSRSIRDRMRGQQGYTLVELIITVAISAVLMSALVSVFLTTWRATNIATSRVDASSQIRNFELFAYNDITTIDASSIAVCATPPCTSPLTVGPVTYAWDPATNFLDRSTAVASRHVATNVMAFSWYIDANSTVVVNLSVQFQNYTESQTFRFYPRVSP